MNIYTRVVFVGYALSRRVGSPPDVLTIASRSFCAFAGRVRPGATPKWLHPALPAAAAVGSPVEFS